ncbi:MAG: ATP-binding protein, partial [Clostridia bacterium]|nr:ATP-binding protein [Clostridia bacterium]
EHFTARGIAFELHAIEINDEVWRARLAKRNAAVEAGETPAYYVDENLAAKFASRYEAPSADEIDVLITE